MCAGTESRPTDEIFTMMRGVPDDDRLFIRDLDLCAFAADRQTGTHRAGPVQQRPG
jgi:hypothetical protein